jgi:myo-inositol-1(or 4)-monophosphatase
MRRGAREAIDPDMSLDAVLEDAVEIVKAAAEIAKAGFGSSPVIQRKPQSDIVTEADKSVEKHIISSLQERYAHHGFLSEEAGEISCDAEYVWVLDPIDGTKYYARGIPLYSISLALQKQGKLILGIVLNPQTGELFCGATDRGATCNDDSIHCSRATQLQETMVCVEIPSRDSSPSQRKWGLGKLAILVEHVQRVRLLGVSALGLCHCASGGFDAYVSLRTGVTQCWDVAAGRAILEAAGGQFLDRDQAIVAGPPELCRQLVELLGLKGGE